MSEQQRDDWDDFLAVKGSLFVLGPIAFGVLVSFSRDAAAWALQHQVVVPEQQSLVVIPGSGVGLDLVRVVVGVLGLAIAGWVGWKVVQYDRRQQARRAVRQLGKDLR